MVIAIDPGPEESAIVRYDAGRIVSAYQLANDDLLNVLRVALPQQDNTLVIEEIVSYGMIAGRSIFQTCVWAGRFAQQWQIASGREVQWRSRTAVKLHLCDSRRATDRDVREVLLHKFGPQGTKKQPGALYGVRGHMFAALALAVTFTEEQSEAVTLRRDK